MPPPGGSDIVGFSPLSLIAPVRFQEPDPGNPLLEPDHVHLWAADLDRGRPRKAEAVRVLSPREKERADRFHFARHRERYLAGRLVLRTLLARYTGVPARELELKTGPRGKPCLAGDGRAAGLCFNQSESKGRTLVALARGREIGVDLEWIDPRLEVRDVSKVALHPLEMKRLLEMGPEERRLRFFILWTVKEAYLKGIGTGLNIAPNRIAVDLDQSPISLTAFSDPPVQDWTVKVFSPWLDFCGALAVHGRIGRMVGLRFEDLPG